ncbi:hypothetical protein [Mycobacterium innocens]|nr:MULTISPECIES: hypothetical protein [Mycobacterium]
MAPLAVICDAVCVAGSQVAAEEPSPAAPRVGGRCVFTDME